MIKGNGYDKDANKAKNAKKLIFSIILLYPNGRFSRPICERIPFNIINVTSKYISQQQEITTEPNAEILSIEELVNKINKTVQNYNAKIRRLQKQNPSLSLPEKISAKSLRNMSDTRKELNRNLQKLKRFSKRGVEENIVLPTGEIVSNYELSELKRESARLQRNLTRNANQHTLRMF